MQTAALPRQMAAGATARRSRSGTDLASLVAPVFELVLKIQAGVVTPSNDLRPSVARLLSDMEQRCAALRYNPDQVQSAKFALAAFVDETVLADNKFPLREEWEKYPLQLEYFGEHLAGVKFFERLEELLKNTEANADVIEVYYLCMLLGFKGKYRKYLEDQLKAVIQNTADHLRRVNRLYEGELSPHWKVTDQPEPPSKPGIPLWVKISAGAGVGLAIMIFMILKLLLRSDIKQAVEQLLR